MIQLPLELVKFGALTCIVKTSLPERIFSGGIFGSKLLVVTGLDRVAIGAGDGAFGFNPNLSE